MKYYGFSGVIMMCPVSLVKKSVNLFRSHPMYDPMHKIHEYFIKHIQGKNIQKNLSD